MAKGFRFKLQPLLDARVRAEDRCKKELAELNHRKQSMLGELRSIQDTIRQSRQELRDTLIGPLSMGRVGSFASFSMEQRMRAQGMVVSMSGLENEIKQAGLRLAEAMKQRKALELLRDRQRQAWLEVQDRRQTAELDELGTQLYLRRRRA